MERGRQFWRSQGAKVTIFELQARKTSLRACNIEGKGAKKRRITWKNALFFKYVLTLYLSFPPIISTSNSSLTKLTLKVSKCLLHPATDPGISSLTSSTNNLLTQEDKIHFQIHLHTPMLWEVLSHLTSARVFDIQEFLLQSGCNQSLFLGIQILPTTYISGVILYIDPFSLTFLFCPSHL